MPGAAMSRDDKLRKRKLYCRGAEFVEMRMMMMNSKFIYRNKQTLSRE